MLYALFLYGQYIVMRASKFFEKKRKFLLKFGIDSEIFACTYNSSQLLCSIIISANDVEFYKSIWIPPLVWYYPWSTLHEFVWESCQYRLELIRWDEFGVARPWSWICWPLSLIYKMSLTRWAKHICSPSPSPVLELGIFLTNFFWIVRW